MARKGAQPRSDVLRPMTRDSLSLQVCEALKAYIVNENLEPGSQLPSERELSEALAVSRNVVREGLSLLVAEGIITKKAGKGIFLREIDLLALGSGRHEILDQERARHEAVREARAAVEVGAIGLIISRITQAELAELEQLVVDLEHKLEQGESFVKEDLRFHLTLLQAARNELLLQWSPMVEEVMRAWVYHRDALASAIRPRTMRQDGARVAAEHRAILEAVRRRDVEEARALLRKHFLVPNL